MMAKLFLLRQLSLFAMLFGIVFGKNQSSDVERQSRSLETILEGLTALDPLAQSFGSPLNSVVSGFEEERQESPQATYQQYPKDLKGSRRPYTSVSSESSESDLFNKQEPFARLYPSTSSRQREQDKLFENYPVLPYPPHLLMFSNFRDFENPKNDHHPRIESHSHSSWKTSEDKEQDGSDDFHENDTHIYPPEYSYKKSPDHDSTNKDETTPFYPSHGTPPKGLQEVRLPIFSNPKYGSNIRSPSRYYNSNSEDRPYSHGKQENHQSQDEGYEITPNIQFRERQQNIQSHSVGHNFRDYPNNHHKGNHGYYGDYEPNHLTNIERGVNTVHVNSNKYSGQSEYSSLHGQNNNYNPNHRYEQLNYERLPTGSTGGYQFSTIQQPSYSYPLTHSIGHVQGNNHNSGYGASDYKTQLTSVNAAALQALQSIKGLDHDASYSFTGLGTSPYNALGSRLSGLYR